MFNWLKKLYVSVMLLPITLFTKCLIPVLRHLIKAKGLDPDKDYDKARKEQFAKDLEFALSNIPHSNEGVEIDDRIKKMIPHAYKKEEEMFDVPQRVEDLPSACFSRTGSFNHDSIKAAKEELDNILFRLKKDHGDPVQSSIEDLLIEFDEDGFGRAKKVESHSDTCVYMDMDGNVEHTPSPGVYDGYSTYFTGEPPIRCSLDYCKLKDSSPTLDCPSVEVTKVTEEDLRVWGDIFSETKHDKDFQVFVHAPVEVSPSKVESKKAKKKVTAKSKKPVKSIKKPAKKVPSKKKK